MAAVLEAPALKPEEVAVVPRKLWTRKEYRKLIDDGYLQDGKVELVNGAIWHKMGQGRKHTATVTWVYAALGKIFGFLRIQGQSSLPVSEYGDPEPDVVVLAQDVDSYISEELAVSEMLLVAEVSNSTLKADLTDKAQQYGSAGIPEYWVVDIPNRLLHVFREPTPDGYASETILTTDDEVRPLAAPASAVRIADLLP